MNYLWLGFSFCFLFQGSEPTENQEKALAAARLHIRAEGAKVLEDFAELLRIPNVANDLPNIHRNAKFIRAALEKRGIQTELLTLPHVPPIVFGELKAPKATKTLMIYVHYDGQPVDPSQWRHNPWEPTLYSKPMEQGGKPIPFPKQGEPIDPEWRLYARAAGDDKAPIIALLAALDALAESGIAPSVNLKFFFEGEEEAGSPNLRQYLETYKDKLEADTWLFCDGPTHQSRKPQIVYGVRGIVSMEMTVYGAYNGLHSGHYGNWAPVPGMVLAHLLASMKDDDGHILIDGFYDSATPIGPQEKAAIQSLPAIEEPLRETFGIAQSEADNAPLAQRLLQPSLTVNGIRTGNVGTKARNVIPPTATARLDFRLVKGNQPQAMLDLVEAHIRKQGFHIVREDPSQELRMKFAKIIKVRRGNNGYPALRTEMDLPIAKQLNQAINMVTGEHPIQMPTLGGSLPLYLFDEVLKTPLLVLPIANHDNHQHAANENLRIENLWYAIQLYAVIFTLGES